MKNISLTLVFDYLEGEENEKNEMVRSLNIHPLYTKVNGVLRGRKQTMIDNNDIRAIFDN